MPMLERPSKLTSYRFDQLADQINQRVMPAEAEVDRYVGLEHLDPDSLRIRRWGDTSEVESTKLLFQPGDIIFGKRRVYQRKVAVADFAGFCSAHAMVLRAKPDTVLPEFLPFLMQSDLFMERALSISVGSLSPTINWKALAKEEFLLPPIQEQARLVETIGAAAGSRERLLDLKASAGMLSESLSQSLFSGVLGGEAKEGSLIASLFDQVIDRGHVGLPILSVTIDGTVVRRDQLERHVSDDTGEQKYLRVLRGDLAYNTMRLWQGAVGIVKEEGLISPAYTVLRPKEQELDIDFFWYLLRSKTMQRQYRRLVTGVASDRWRLYFKDLKKVRVSLPKTEVEAQLWESLKNLSDHSASIEMRIQSATDTLRMLQRECFHK
jgi:hypothetical protein